MLRMVLPKGTSFEFLTQWDVNLIVNHINSTPRESVLVKPFCNTLFDKYLPVTSLHWC